MNQPSAEDIVEWVQQAEKTWMLSGASKLGDKDEFICDRVRAILDRYHLLDKTEPIPGAVSAEQVGSELFQMNTGSCREKGENLLARFDIYPKGTVARLMGEVDEAWEAESQKQIEYDDLWDEAKGYKDELDRIKGQQLQGPFKTVDDNPETPESSKVVLPDVPSHMQTKFDAIIDLIECYRAVKAHLEGK